MNPNEHERLSRILTDIQHEIDLGIGGHNLDQGNTSIIADRITEARTIVDNPTPPIAYIYKAGTPDEIAINPTDITTVHPTP